MEEVTCTKQCKEPDAYSVWLFSLGWKLKWYGRIINTGLFVPWHSRVIRYRFWKDVWLDALKTCFICTMRSEGICAYPCLFCQLFLKKKISSCFDLSNWVSMTCKVCWIPSEDGGHQNLYPKAVDETQDLNHNHLH